MSPNPPAIAIPAAFGAGSIASPSQDVAHTVADACACESEMMRSSIAMIGMESQCETRAAELKRRTEVRRLFRR